MKKALCKIVLSFSLMFQAPLARADMFGGDVVVLGQILIQTIQQLIQLKKMVSSAKEEINFVKNINAGINDSIQLIADIDPNFDPGVLKTWQHTAGALREIEKLYGVDERSKNSEVFALTDKTVAETVVFNNKAYKNATRISKLSQQIKRSSQASSPGGAQKITAQSMGVLLGVQSESLKAQAKELKLHAQVVARNNQKDKVKALQIIDTVDDIVGAMKNQKNQEKFQLPRL